MRNSILVIVAGTALFVAGAPYAGEKNRDSNATDVREIVCKSGPPLTGTRIGPTRICKTKAQWEQEQQQARKTLSDIQTKRGCSYNHC